jgi:hypothetical protein
MSVCTHFVTVFFSGARGVTFLFTRLFSSNVGFRFLPLSPGRHPCFRLVNITNFQSLRAEFVAWWVRATARPDQRAVLR